MSNNLVEIIFEQFLGIVEKQAHKFCFDFDECDFKFKVREGRFVLLIDVLFRVKLKCDRWRDVIVTIDFTSICFEHLPTKKWRQYLKKLAKEFLADIVGENKPHIPEKERIRKCREEPEWCRFPTKCTTVIRRPCKPKIEKPKIKVLIEKECECIPICKPVKCDKKREILIKCDRFPKKHGCGCDDKHDDKKDWKDDDCKDDDWKEGDWKDKDWQEDDWEKEKDCGCHDKKR